MPIAFCVSGRSDLGTILALTTLQRSSTDFHEMYRNAEPSDAAAAQAAYEQVCADYQRTAEAIASFRDQQ